MQCKKYLNYKKTSATEFPLRLSSGLNPYRPCRITLQEFVADFSIIQFRRRIFCSPLGNKIPKRGAYLKYVSTEEAAVDNAVGEKGKSNVCGLRTSTF